MPEAPVPPDFFHINLGQVLQVCLFLGAIGFATCHGITQIGKEIRSAMRENHDAIMREESQRIAEGEQTQLFQIIERVFYRLFRRERGDEGCSD